MGVLPPINIPALIQGFDFEGTQVRIIDVDGESVIPRADVTRALEYADPETAARLIMNRNPVDFEGCHTPIKLIGVTGEHETIGLTERGVYAMAFLAKTKKAAQFRRAAAALLEAIRKGKVNVDPLRAQELEIAKLQAEATKLQAELEARRMTGLAYLLKHHGGRISTTHFDALVAQITGQVTHVPKTYSSTEMGILLSGRLNQTIGHVHVGRAATLLGIRPPEGEETTYAGWTVTKARGADKTVYTVFYKNPAIDLFQSYFRQNPVKPKKGTVQQQRLDLAVPSIKGSNPDLLLPSSYVKVR